MSGSSNVDNVDLHIYMGDALIHREISISNQLTIGAVCDTAINEMASHLHLPPTTMRTDQVQIYGGHRSKNKTVLKDLTKTKPTSSVIAVIPPPAGFSIEKLLDEKLERLKHEYETRITEVERKHETRIKEAERKLSEAECKLSEAERKLSEAERELSNLQEQLRDSNNWLIHGDTEAFDKIILRNLLDKAQEVLVHALGLGSNPLSRNFLSHDWRAYVMNIDESARNEQVKALLYASTNPTIHQLSACPAVLNILTDSSPHIRTDGDKVAHGQFINQARYRDAIGRCKSSAERQALDLFLNLIITYRY